jgi:hypothetical protein
MPATIRLAPLALLLLGGCVINMTNPPLRYGALSPRPNTAINGYHDKTITLRFGKTVPSQFTTPGANGCVGLDVSQWQVTLTNGFNAAFSEGFRIVNEDAEYTLTILDAQPGLRPAAVNGYGGVVACAVSLRYKVALDGPGGRQNFAGDAAARNAAGATDQDMASAVEGMYETLAAKLFAYGPGETAGPEAPMPSSKKL